MRRLLDSLARSIGRSLLLRGLAVSAVLAVVMAVLSLTLVVNGARSTVLRTATGQVENVPVHTRKGVHDSSALTLRGAARDYTFNRKAFSPALDDSALAPGSTVEVWYTENIFGEADVVALRTSGTNGGAATMYVTPNYTDRERANREDVLLAALCGGVALLCGGAFALLLRVRREVRARRDVARTGVLVRSDRRRPQRSASPPVWQERGGGEPFWERQLREQRRER